MSETKLDPRDRLAVMVSMAGSYIESGRGDDALAVIQTVAEDVATEISRLTRELEAAREVLEDARDALEVLPPGILGEVSEAVEASDGEVGVRSWTIRDELIDRVSRALLSGSGTPPGEGEAIPGRFTAAEGRALRIAANVLANYEFKMLPLQLRKAADKIDAARRGEGGGE